jgi:hypothetical protein
MGDLEGKIVSQIQKRLRETADQGFSAVRLSPIVDSFGIEPIPRFDPQVRNGRLHYDREQGRFVITLGHLGNTYAGQSPGLLDARWTGIEDPLLTRRLRFTYAHEVAHRFCFFQEGAHWMRALEAAVLDKRTSTKFEDSSRLELNEERLCNRVAGRLLVPEDVLCGYMHSRLQRESSSLIFDLNRELCLAASLFKVSEDCVFIELQKAAERGTIAFPTNLCAFSVKVSNQIGPKKIGLRKLRVRTALLPNYFNGFKLKRIFPGMDAENLGAAFYSWISDSRWEAVKNSTGEIEIPIILLTENGETNSKRLILRGWFRFNGRTEDKTNQGILVWGFLCEEQER